jgi:hypothetical protein
VRALVETKALVGERGASPLAAPLATIQVPTPSKPSQPLRIDRLPPEEKHLLQTAGVMETPDQWASIPLHCRAMPV